MTRGLHIVLILLLCLTGASLGAARGTVRVAGEVQLCAGAAVVTVRLDANGNVVPDRHICPDMALSLMAAYGAAPLAIPVNVATGVRVAALQPTVGQGADPPPRRARDPPSLNV